MNKSPKNKSPKNVHLPHTDISHIGTGVRPHVRAPVQTKLDSTVFLLALRCSGLPPHVGVTIWGF